MAPRRLYKVKGTKATYRVAVPVFRVPSPEEFDTFASDPLGQVKSASKNGTGEGTQRFYAALRYPDSEVDAHYQTP